MKRIVSLVLALSMVLGLCATAFASVNLTDVAGTKYEAAVEALIELEVVAGYPNGKYQPTKEVNRAELAKMLVICMGLEEDAERASGDNVFTDESLKDGEAYAWARGYINTAATAGVIKGYPTGEFKPEKTVTYAEALTMMLRALGYGNVMEAEGTWPTNAILKARELELTDDVKYNSSSDGATRGDIAILLWNMLRTPMWKISSENQGTGMTSEMGSIMLNVKFPDYVYGEGTLTSYEINDGEVTVEVADEDLDEGKVEGTVTDIDLLRLVDGMEVSYLYNIEDEEFLTLTTLEDLIEGRVKTNKKGKLEVNDKEYKNLAEAGASDGDYVVFFLDGKKVEALVVLPEDGAYEIGAENGKTLKKAKKLVGEDALVIIDGEWLTNEDLKEGDVVTEVTPDNGDAHYNGDAYYVVARERVTGEFESFTKDEDFDETRYYLEVEGEEYEAEENTFTVYEYDEDDEEYKDVTEDALDEFANKKGKYFGEDVELVLDYLGNVINLYYGEVKDTEDDDYNFYVMTGKYAWDESSRDGRVYYYDIAGVNGEDTYTFTPELYNDLLSAFENTSMYEQFNDKVDNDGKLAKALVDSLVFAATLNDDEELESDETELAKYFAEYTIESADNTDGIFDEKDEDYIDGKDHKVTSSTVVFTIKAIIDENKDGDDEVVGIEVEVSEGKDALEGVNYAKYYVAQEENDGSYEDKTKAISYIFVGENAKSTDLNFGLVEKLTTRKGVDYITISGTKYELDEDGLQTAVGELVSYRVDEDVAKVMDKLNVTDLDDGAAITVTDVKDGVVYLSAAYNGSTNFDLDREVNKKEFEDTTFVLGTVSADEDDNLEFDSDVDVLGEGIEKVTFKKGDRLVKGNNDVIAVIRGIKVDEKVENGALVEDAE